MNGFSNNTWYAIVRSKQVILWYFYIPYILELSYRLAPGSSLPACNPSDSWSSYRTYHEQARRTQHGFRRGQRWVVPVNRGPPQQPSRSKTVRRWWCGRAKPRHTRYAYTREERTIKLSKGTLWANVLGIFSRAPAHS